MIPQSKAYTISGGVVYVRVVCVFIPVDKRRDVRSLPVIA